MTSRILVSLSFSLLLLSLQLARAQTADDFFYDGAQSYLSNNIPDALKKVETGRQIYPSDIKLKKLEELLKQQQQQNQQNQKNQSQQNKNSQNQPQSQQQQKNQSNPQNQQQNQSQPQPAQKQNSGQQPQQSMAMTPEEAKRLLDSQKGNEQVLQFNSKNQPQNQIPPVKDW